MDPVVASYGALLVVGGLMGFLKGSKVSLIAGSGSGILFLFFSQDIKENLDVATGLAGLLSLVMGFRAAKSGKFMPPGMVALLSFLTTGYLVSKR